MLEFILVTLYMVSMAWVILPSIELFCINTLYLRSRKKPTPTPPLQPISALSDDQVPVITIQLPLYNERYVVRDLIDCIVQLDYPKAKLEIQVLDDSTDDTSTIVAERVRFWKEQGFSIHHIQRPNRDGFKAGALAEGMKTARGSLLAIFDADFRPPPDFLQRTVPYFADENIGMVQGRWGHKNADASLLTRLQAFMLDAYFLVEKTTKQKYGLPILFNGSGGIWRKACIEDAGGWQSDTLLEDFDLSYRAQLRNWRFHYLPDLVLPAELPENIAAYRIQFHRWTKGYVEIIRKHARNIRESTLPRRSKWMMLLYPLRYSGYVGILFATLLGPPVIAIAYTNPAYENVLLYALPILLTPIVYGGFFFFSLYEKAPTLGRAIRQFVMLYPPLMAFLASLSLVGTRANWEAYRGKRTPFVRTPKFNPDAVKAKALWKRKRYASRKIPTVAFTEIVIGLFFVASITMDIYLGYWIALPFHALIAAGFLGFSGSAIVQARQGA